MKDKRVFCGEYALPLVVRVDVYVESGFAGSGGATADSAGDTDYGDLDDWRR